MYSPNPFLNEKQPADLLIKNGTILTMDQTCRVIPHGAIVIRGQKIISTGESASLEAKFQATETLDAAGMLVMPGLINAHTHSGDSLFRGLVEDLPLEKWLQKLWVAEGKFVTAETVELAATLSYIEMVRCGITCAVDMFWFPEAMVAAARSVGMRLITGPVYFDSSATDNIRIEDRTRLAREFLIKYAGDDQITACIQPHSLYTVSPEFLSEAGRLAQEFGVLFHTHASETRTEVDNCLRKFDLTPIQYLDKLGLLDKHTLLAHCVHLTAEEIHLLKERNVTVAHCPISNLKLASGIAPVGQMHKAGVNIALGTDGPVSGNDLNLWISMRFAAIVQKAVNQDPSLLSTREIAAMVTSKAAAALGLADRIGSIETGKTADLILIELYRPHTTPVFDPFSLLVYNIGREDVDTVLVNGRIIMKHRKILTLDEETVIKSIAEISVQIAANL